MAVDLLAPDKTVYTTASQQQTPVLARHEQQALAAFVDTLRRQCPELIDQIYLYGSVARGDAKNYSDIDVFVALAQPATPQEIAAIRETALDLSIVFGCALHPLIVSSSAMAWHRRGSSLWLNVQRDGIELWHSTDTPLRLPIPALREEPAVMLTPAQHDEIRIHMEHAREDLEIAATLIDARHHRVAVARCYYAAFYAISALLMTKGVVRSKHGAVRAAVHQYLVRTGILTPAQGKLFDQLQYDRQDADYDMQYAPGPEIAAERLVQSRGLVEQATAYLQNSGYL